MAPLARNAYPPTAPPHPPADAPIARSSARSCCRTSAATIVSGFQAFHGCRASPSARGAHPTAAAAASPAHPTARPPPARAPPAAPTPARAPPAAPAAHEVRARSPRVLSACCRWLGPLAGAGQPTLPDARLAEGSPEAGATRGPPGTARRCPERAYARCRAPAPPPAYARPSHPFNGRTGKVWHMRPKHCEAPNAGRNNEKRRFSWAKPEERAGGSCACSCACCCSGCCPTTSAPRSNTLRSPQSTPRAILLLSGLLRARPKHGEAPTQCRTQYQEAPVE